MVGDSRLCAQAASLQGQTAFLHFYGWIHHWKVIFPGGLETMTRVSGTAEDSTAQHETHKPARECQFEDMEPSVNQAACLSVTQALFHYMKIKIINH